MTTIGFVGLGTMGLAMAGNLLKGGHTVIGFDTSATAMDNHVLNGGTASPSASQAAEGADVVITMLPNGQVVRQAIFDPGGIAETMKAGALLIDMSTIHPTETDDIRKGLASRDIRMVDAPVGRTSVEAAEGRGHNAS